MTSSVFQATKTEFQALTTQRLLRLGFLSVTLLLLIPVLNAQGKVSLRSRATLFDISRFKVRSDRYLLWVRA